MPTIADQMQERMDSRPDKNTLAWWESQFTEVAKGYRGLTHAANLLLAEIEDRDDVVNKMHLRLEDQVKELQEAKAAIGKLQAEFVEFCENSRKAYAELRTKIKS